MTQTMPTIDDQPMRIRQAANRLDMPFGQAVRAIYEALLNGELESELIDDDLCVRPGDVDRALAGHG